MRLLRLLAFVTAGFAYAIIVLGFVVRITGSGMGCGDDWPLCNGSLLPTFDHIETVIEFSHRLAVLCLSGFTVVVGIVAYGLKATTGGACKGGTLRPAGLAVGLLVLQSLLGAITVKLELPASTIVLHLGTALVLLSTLIVLGLRAGVHSGITEPAPGAGSARGGIFAALGLAAVVILMGGVTAATGAFTACRGFPLCNGSLWPAGGPAHLQWIHRLLAYLLFFHLFGMAMALRKRQSHPRVQVAGWAAFGLAVIQVTVGATMVLAGLHPGWRVIHAAVGTAVWVALTYTAWLAAGLPPTAQAEA
jgi:heme A synthase